MDKSDIRRVSYIALVYGAVLERVINAAGVPYSLIMIDGDEVWNCPTSDEDKMIQAWKKDGRRIMNAWRIIRANRSEGR